MTEEREIRDLVRGYTALCAQTGAVGIGWPSPVKICTVERAIDQAKFISTRLMRDGRKRQR